jgi:hypothetical protein
MMITLHSKIKPSPQAIYTQLSEDEGVLLHMDTKRYYTLNETGSVIWNHLGKGFSLSEIAEKLQQEYEVEIQQAQNSVVRLAQELQQEKLVAVHND